jgi:NAD(P)-dependent dehydrogenase (short-subunit alcohol dehydrogenase family)
VTRSVIVTGGSRGIGKAIAAAFVAAGDQVAIVSRDDETCKAAAAALGGRTIGIGAHVADADAASAAMNEVLERFGGLDILVNNAATNPYSGPTIDIDEPRWRKILDVNLTAPLIWSQLAWRLAMRDGPGGASILNIGSVGGLWTSPDHGPYDVSKAALHHLTKQLAAELGPKARVNCIAPGLTKTDFNYKLFEDDPEGRSIAPKYPMQRLGRREDVPNAALFLASEAASWITGQLLVIDGGGQIGFERTG